MSTANENFETVIMNAVVIPIAGASDFQKAITQALQAGAKITPRTAAVDRPPREPRPPVDPVQAARQVYVNGLAWDTTEASLVQLFSKSSGFQKASLMTRLRGEEVVSKGCGIIEFATPKDAQLAAESLNNTELDGRKIRVRGDRGATPPQN
eukprot:gene35810-44159_t